MKLSNIMNIVLLLALAVSIYILYTSIADMRNSISLLTAKVEGELAELRADLARINSSLSRYDIEGRLSDVESRIEGLRRELGELGALVRGALGHRVSVKYAAGFSLAYDGPVKVVVDGENRTILLAPGNMSDDDLAFYVGKYSPDLVVRTPVERVVLFSATQVALLARLDEEFGLGLLDRVVGVAWGGTYKWYIPGVEERFNDGRWTDVGYASNPNYELLLKLRPDLVVIYTVPGYEASEKLVQRLDELGIPYVVDNEWREETVLGRFEWVKFLAAFFDVEDRAGRLFDMVERAVLSYAAKVADAGPVNVAWFSIYRGTVYAAPPGSYVHDLIRLAGGRYLYGDVPYVSGMELVVKRGNYTDVLVYASSPEFGPSSIGDLLSAEPRLGEVKAVREGRVYLFSSDYFQLGYAYTELLVRDLAAILHPSLFQGVEPRFFVRLE